MDIYLILWVIKRSPERQNEQDMCVCIYIHTHIYTCIWGVCVCVCVCVHEEKLREEFQGINSH